MKLSNLIFKPHPILFKHEHHKELSITSEVALTLKGNVTHIQAVHCFNNGYEISVVTGPNFYSSRTAPYELMMTKGAPFDDGNGNSNTGNPYGYLNQTELEALMTTIENLNPI